jgi:uncharacterized membrane protein
MRSILPILMVMTCAMAAFSQNGEKAAKPEAAVSFKNDVFPIISKNCLPCHAEDNFNPSELSLDNYKLLMAGGKNGKSVIAGKSKESLMIKKLAEDPPFGDRMPLNTKKKIREGKATWLTEEEVKTISAWIDQGAKNN